MCDRWMKRTGREVRDFDEATVRECLRWVAWAARRGYGKKAAASTLRRLLGRLRRMGAAPPSKTEFPSQMEQLIGRYERFLLDERNLVLDSISWVRSEASWPLRNDLVLAWYKQDSAGWARAR
jgi:hypothetical protein